MQTLFTLFLDVDLELNNFNSIVHISFDRYIVIITFLFSFAVKPTQHLQPGRIHNSTTNQHKIHNSTIIITRSTFNSTKHHIILNNTIITTSIAFNTKQISTKYFNCMVITTNTKQVSSL